MFHCDFSDRERMVHGNQFIMGLKEMFMQVRKKHDVKAVEMQILIYLNMEDETRNTSSDICKHLHMNKAQVSKTLDALSKRGFVSFEVDAKDRRFVHYFLTEKAVLVMQDLNKVWKYAQEKLFVGLTQEEIDEYMRISKIMHQNLMALSNEEEEE